MGIRLSAILFVIVAATANAQEIGERFELVNLGRNVNSGYHEGGVVVSRDGNTLYFFVNNHPDNNYGTQGSQDIWVSRKQEDGSWTKAEHLGQPLNNHHSNQVFTILPDGTLFIRGGNSRNSKGFSFTRPSGSGWSNPQEIDVEDFKKMNQGRFYGATMSSDQQVMIIYMSEKENSTWSDLYVSRRQSNGSYSRPQKIGEVINTTRDEFSPFIAPDDRTMYFSSSRKDIGYGSADIYMTRRLDDTWMKWSEPVNLGKVVNSKAFDAYLTVDENGHMFVTQSGRTIDGGNLDVFEIKEKKVLISLKGLVSDKKTQAGVYAELMISRSGEVADTVMTNMTSGVYSETLRGEGDFTINVSADGYVPTSASLSLKDIYRDTVVIKDFILTPIKRNAILSGTLYDKKTGEAIDGMVQIEMKSGGGSDKVETANGYYEKELEEEDWYMLTGTKEGYINATDSIEYMDTDQTLFSKDLYLEPIEIGTTVRLKNIFFDFDKTTLKEESFIELNKVVDFLNQNESLEIEIAGHTDSKGSDDYNLNLSQGRAQAVVDYLVSQGIDEFRLVAKGYGETVPIDTNDTDEGRAQNRRVEFTVLKK